MSLQEEEGGGCEIGNDECCAFGKVTNKVDLVKVSDRLCKSINI